MLAAQAALATPAARAQTPVSAAPAALLVGVEAAHDSLRYRFENPSSTDTSFLVPHSFEQTYDTSNLWVVATARYTAGVRWETEAGLTPQRTGRADDLDTFIDPGNIVIVSGTTGDASRHAIRVSQIGDVTRAGPVRVFVGYRFRWDRFDFHAGHKTVTRDGVLIADSVVTSPEMTDSKIHEVLAGVRAEPALGRLWRLVVSGEIAPATVARLSVQLPEKYPGQDLVFTAKAWAIAGRMALARAGGRFPVEVALRLDRTFSYQPDAEVERSAQSVGVSVGWSW